MNKFARIGLTAVALVLVASASAFAQEGDAAKAAAPTALISFSASFGVGLVVIGAALGISRLASSAYESMARQPEVAGTINTAMIIAAALIEGFTFYALVICSGKV